MYIASLALFKHGSSLFLLIFPIAYLNCDALLLKCPLHQMHLQKIIGFRPPLEYMHEHNLIYSPANNYKDRNRFSTPIDQNTPYTNKPFPQTTEQQTLAITPPPEPTTSELCRRLCNEDIDCIAYVHLLDTNECYGYSYFEHSSRYLEIGAELPLVADSEAIFYEKTCLNVPENCKNRIWALTKIPGMSLLFHAKKTLATLVTRRECAESCLHEQEFQCLSASFAPSYRNNRERNVRVYDLFVQNTQQGPPHYQALGRCMLSDQDKMLKPEAFRAAPYDEEYIENHCYDRPMENASCAYELYANSTFAYAETVYAGLSQKECQTRCTYEPTFYCQGVSYYFNGDITRSECQLHSEDVISMGPRSLKLRQYSIYMRRVKCLDVQVICTRDEMSIKYAPKEKFHGKMYVNMHSKDCLVDASNTNNNNTNTDSEETSAVLRLSIGSEAKENRCGILRAYEVTQDTQRTFISALVVIQNNPNVQTQGDRLIKVGCIMSNATTVSNKEQQIKSASNLAGSGDSADSQSVDDDLEAHATGIPEDDMPNAIALESSLEFTQHFLPNEGALYENNETTFTPTRLPMVTLHVIDLAHQHQTNDVQIGQNLELQIVAEYTQQQLQKLQNLQHHKLNGITVPNFRASQLIANTVDKQNYVLLIDKNGCATDVSVFPELERLRTNSKNILRARFHAFKFAGTADVNFSVKIHFCDSCSEENCMHHGMRNQTKYTQQQQRRRRRRSRRQSGNKILVEEQHLKIQNPVYISTVEDIDANATEQQSKISNISNKKYEAMQMPVSANDSSQVGLQYNLHVRGPDQGNSNSFIYGERGILLIAGIDDHMRLDTFCVNQSLLIATLIFWLIFQVALLFGCCYIIQKYKSLANFEEERRKIQESLVYLEGRRVHWADQGGYTL